MDYAKVVEKSLIKDLLKKIKTMLQINKNSTFRKTSRQAGFTLIELLVTIVIIGILSTISVSTYGGFIEKARIAKIQYIESQIETQQMAASVSNMVGPMGKWDFNTGNGTVARDSYVENDITHASLNDYWSSDTMDGLGYSVYLGDGTDSGTGATGLSITSLSIPAEGEMSFAFRFKFASMDFQNRLIHLYCRNAGGDREFLKFWFNYSVSGRRRFYLQQYNTVTTTWETIFQTDVESIREKKWHHVMVSYDSDKAQLYFDGDLKSSLSSPPDLNMCEEDGSKFYGTSIGDRGVAGSDAYFDNVRIWKKSFTSK